MHRNIVKKETTAFYLVTEIDYNQAWSLGKTTLSCHVSIFRCLNYFHEEAETTFNINSPFNSLKSIRLTGLEVKKGFITDI